MLLAEPVVEPPGGRSTPPELNLEGLLAIGCGHTAFQLLWAGADLDLFSLLAQHESLDRVEIARCLGLELQPTRILLNGLTALGIVVKSGEDYSNSAAANRWLVRGRSGCIVPLLQWQHHIVYPGLFDFTASLRQNRNVGLRHFPGSGDTLYQRLATLPKLELVFQDAMSTLSCFANRALADMLDLADSTCLLDIGGGDATNAINLVQRQPHLRAIVFDSASICRRAEQHITACGLARQITAVPGDCHTDPLPTEADAILLAHMLTIWSPQKNCFLLGKCFRALPPGGKLLIFNMAFRDDETGPLLSALGSPYFQSIATGEGMLYCAKDYEQWLREAGFAQVARTELPMEHTLLVATK